MKKSIPVNRIRIITAALLLSVAAAFSAQAEEIRTINTVKPAASATEIITDPAAETASASAAVKEMSASTDGKAEASVKETETSAAADGSVISGSFGILQNEKYDNLDETPVLSGGEVRFLHNAGGAAQQLSAVFKSSDGKIIVVDGGQAEDTEHLVSVVRELGNGHVDAWLITHPHSDHVGALAQILKSGRKDISIGSVYCNFLDQSWYEENDAEEAGMAAVLRAELQKRLPADRLYASAGRGDTVTLSDYMNFRVLNSPVKSTGIFAGNSAGLMYDITVNGQHFIITGDMGEAVGTQLIEAGVLDGIVCDYAQVSHHGQNGVGEDFYQKLNPKNCIWPSNEYIYKAEGSKESGLKTTLTKLWISKLPVRHNYVTLGRDVIIR